MTFGYLGHGCVPRPRRPVSWRNQGCRIGTFRGRRATRSWITSTRAHTRKRHGHASLTSQSSRPAAACSSSMTVSYSRSSWRVKTMRSGALGSFPWTSRAGAAKGHGRDGGSAAQHRDALPPPSRSDNGRATRPGKCSDRRAVATAIAVDGTVVVTAESEMMRRVATAASVPVEVVRLGR